MSRTRLFPLLIAAALAPAAMRAQNDVHVAQPPAPCHANPRANADIQAVLTRGDVRRLPQALRVRLATLAGRPHSQLPTQAYAEADQPSRLFQYYLLDTTGFEPNVFTTTLPGVNDAVMLTATGGNCGLPTVGGVRVVLEPKPDLPTDPNDPRAFIDIFTDISGLFVINNESGWYEGWMIHDLTVPDSAPPRGDGHAQFGKLTDADKAALQLAGDHNNVPAHVFTTDGRAPRLPSAGDHWPDAQSNVVPIQLSMGAYNALQQSDAHQYWEFNYQTNWIHPLYELPFAGGFPDHRATEPADTFRDGELLRFASVVPGLSIGLNLDRRRAVMFGDNPDRPRDPDLFDSDNDAQREFRERFVPSGVAREAFLNTFERLASFEPWEHDLTRRLNDGYKAAVALLDTNNDGIISAPEGDIDTPNPHCPSGDNSCFFLVPRQYDRFAVTREINDGFLAPRFAPSTRGWVLAGTIVTGFPVLQTSEGRDSDDR
jgi:hypothetical protein